MKRLFLDIETSPNVVYSFQTGYNLTITPDAILDERTIITAAYKWQGNDKVRDLTWKHNDDFKLVADLLPVMNSADEIVAHYGDRFDVPWVRTRALFHGIVCPQWKTVDTKAWASKYFLFNSNKLDYLARFLGIGCKIKTDFDLWKRVKAGDKQALKDMVRYNKQDVVLLEKVYDRLAIYSPLHSHVGVMEGKDRYTCPGCGNSEGLSHTHIMVSRAGAVKHQMRCGVCPRYFMISAAAFKLFPNKDRGRGRPKKHA